jgi:hypothetical protein
MTIRDAFTGLGRNLASGARLALFRPIDRRAFQVDLVAWLMVILMSAVLGIVLDGLRAAPGSRFTLEGLDAELYAVGLLMVTTALIAALTRDDLVFTGLAIVVLASFPLLQILHALPAIAGVTLVNPVGLVFETLLFAWMIVVCVRAVFTMSERPERRRRWRSVLGGLLLSLPLWAAPFAGPTAGWWSEPDDTPGNDAANPASEPVMAAQSYLLDQALDDLDDPRPGVPDLYFVGFAPDARKGGFRAEIDDVRHALDDRFGTGGRSINLVNHASTVAEAPFATLTNLHRVLTEIGEAIERDEDVVMLYLAAPGTAEHGLAAVHPPLDLVSVTPDALRHLLDDAGIRYRVIVVSSCAAGAWLDALRDDDTAVLVAAAGDDRPAGCGGGASPTPFGQSFVSDALGKTESVGSALVQSVGEGSAARLAMGAGVEAQLRRVVRGAPVRTASTR